MKNKNFVAFIEEGMKSYKKASEVAALFRNEVENILKSILKARTDWGPFEKNTIKQPQSSKYWTEYPYINANLQGQFKGSAHNIRLAINWMSADYPIFSILFYDKNESYKEEMEQFDWRPEFSFEKDLRFTPNPDDLDIERDFNLLIDEFVRFMKSLI